MARWTTSCVYLLPVTEQIKMGRESVVAGEAKVGSGTLAVSVQ